MFQNMFYYYPQERPAWGGRCAGLGVCGLREDVVTGKLSPEASSEGSSDILLGAAKGLGKLTPSCQ